MAWLVLIDYQTQADEKVLRPAAERPAGAAALIPGASAHAHLAEAAVGAPEIYLAVNFCSAIWPAAPSLSASFTLAQRARAWSAFPSAT